MMDLFRKNGIPPRNGELLVDAFDVCYSNAEVYRRSHIEKVFGPIDQMDEDIFFHMIRMMTEGLSSRWRKHGSATGVGHPADRSRKRSRWSATGTRRPST